jgi:hypothetical protein
MLAQIEPGPRLVKRVRLLPVEPQRLTEVAVSLGTVGEKPAATGKCRARCGGIQAFHPRLA